jgi:hypothetical protein
MALPMSHLDQPRSVRLIGAIALRTAISVLVLVMLMVLAEAWVPDLVDPMLLQLGI